MDSVTQFALGAAIGEATLGRKAGYRAALWGGVCATLPDLDSFVPFADAVASFTYHRSASHSLLVLPLLVPLLVWMIRKAHPGLAGFRKQWYLLVFLALETHPLLDAFTVYGTQLFWPLSEYPVSGSTVFIVDPAYTLPLLIGVMAALCLSRQKNTGHRLNYAGIVLSSCYLAWTVGAKIHVEYRAREALQRQNIEYSRLMSTPAPFNTIVWRVIAMQEHGYVDGFYSFRERQDTIKFTHYSSDRSLLRGIETHWPVRRLQWFTHGFFKVSADQGAIFMTDLRMGLEPNYIFRFKVAEISNPHPVPVTSVLMPEFTGGPGLARMTD